MWYHSNIKKPPFSSRDTKHVETPSQKSQFFEEDRLDSVDHSILKITKEERNPIFSAGKLEDFFSTFAGKVKEAEAENVDKRTQREQEKERKRLAKLEEQRLKEEIKAQQLAQKAQLKMEQEAVKAAKAAERAQQAALAKQQRELAKQQRLEEKQKQQAQAAQSMQLQQLQRQQEREQMLSFKRQQAADRKALAEARKAQAAALKAAKEAEALRHQEEERIKALEKERAAAQKHNEQATTVQETTDNTSTISATSNEQNTSDELDDMFKELESIDGQATATDTAKQEGETAAQNTEGNSGNFADKYKKQAPEPKKKDEGEELDFEKLKAENERQKEIQTIRAKNMVYTVFLIKGEDRGRKAWYYLRVEKTKKNLFMKAVKQSSINLDDYGVVIYSAYGEDPPEDIKKKVHEEYEDVY